MEHEDTQEQNETSKPKRLFIAIAIPGDIKDRLRYAYDDRAIHHNEWRFTAKENLHITLLFLGATPEEKIYEVSDIASQCAGTRKPFNIVIDKIALGPPQGERRMIWAHIEDNPHLAAASDCLKEKLIGMGFDSLQKDPKHFSPHITLARKRVPMKRLQTRNNFSVAVSESFRTETLDVMQSDLRREGAEYAVTASFPFSG